MNNFGLTTHTVIKNEEKFIKEVILSLIDFKEIKKMLVWDTGSTDKTVALIKTIKSPKISFKECGLVDREGLVKLREEQLLLTKTPWFLILDGDEVWPKRNFEKLIEAMKKAKKETLALVNRTRNCLGDIYHYLPENKGKYKIGPWRGHLNIRAIRKVKDLKVEGCYPLEAYTYQGIPLQNLVSRLEFVDVWYLHATHLKRTNWYHQLKVVDRFKKWKFLGFRKTIKMEKNELPEILIQKLKSNN